MEWSESGGFWAFFYKTEDDRVIVWAGNKWWTKEDWENEKRRGVVPESLRAQFPERRGSGRRASVGHSHEG